MGCHNHRLWAIAQSYPNRGAFRSCAHRLLTSILGLLFLVTTTSATPSHTKNVLIITDVSLSQALTNVMIQQIVGGVREDPDRHVEFYLESLDLISKPGRPTIEEIREWLVKKYGDQKIDVVVAIGPDAVRFFANRTQSMFLGPPIVICGTSADQAGNPTLDSRFTGTWTKRDAAKTVGAALKIFPETRGVAVVAGTSSFDRLAGSLTKEELRSFGSRLEVTDFSEFEMGELLERLRHLSAQTIVLYVSFFQDAAGNKFVNATKALPMVAEASNAPVFGMSDTYLGNGIVGGVVMNFQEQGKATARIISDLLNGKTAQDIPMVTYPSVPMFDRKALQRWHIQRESLPAGSIIVPRELSLWERTRWMWVTALLVVLGLSSLVVYLQYSRRKLKLAEERRSQLSGMLIGAEEKERSRVASELHDDFSQRIALLALGMENITENLPGLPNETSRQLHELSNTASELGSDLHTLSHRLHSSTLERLGLVPGVSAFCREFQAQQGVQVKFDHDEIPPGIPEDIALCVFRIVQEGLRNVGKHSGATEAQVVLHMNSGKLIVRVSDQGSGFEMAKFEKKGALGLLSMEERVRLAGGHFNLQSEPGKGTRLEAWVPVKRAFEAGAS
jgi:signal transduction histidine kinase